MKFEEHRHSIPSDDRTPLPKGETKPCMRGVLDLDLYNRTGEIRMIEPLMEFVPPPITGDEDVEIDRMVKGRMRILNPNKPSKEKLEQHLRDGMSADEIGKEYDAHKTSVYNWIKAYGLQGIKGVKKSKTEEVPVIEVQDDPPVNDMVQHSPSLAEIEQFHTDNPVQELPKVEMDPVLIIESYTHNEGKVETTGPIDPDLKIRETFDEIWQDVRSDLVTLERLYVAQAKKSFRDEFREMVAKVVGES